MIAIEDNHMVETFSADASNYSFRIRILKRRMGRCDHFLNLHPLHSTPKFFSIRQDRIFTKDTDIQNRKAMTLDTTLMAYSMTKTFTANE
jgi:hypothetical protein